MSRLRGLWDEHSGRILRFGIVGVGGTLLYAALAYGGLALGWPLMVSHVVASAISLAFSYGAQKIFTFGISGQHRRAGPRFAFATAVVVAAHTLLVFGLKQAGVDPDIALLAGIVFYPPASYLIHSYWTFRL